MKLSTQTQRTAVLAAALLLANAAQAQVASAIVREGIAIPNGPPTETISSITSVMTNNAGGYAVRFDSTGSGTTLSNVWGAATGGPGALLRTEGMFASYTQTAFETFFGVDDAGRVSYSPTLTVGDSTWLDSTPIVVDSVLEPSTGLFWSFGSRPLISGVGTPYCIAGLSATAGGSTSTYAFVKGVSGMIVFKSGDTLPGMPGPIGTASTPIDFDYAISAGDSHHIMTVKLAGAPSLADEYVIYDGAVLTIGGVPIIEGTAVPAAVGGVGGESWGTFDFFACTESGHYLFSGDTDAATTADEYLLVDGVFRHREGDIVDGFPTVNGLQTATMNESGTVAYVWEVVTTGGNLEALFVEDDIVLMEGDAVDLDGDGMVEPTSIVSDIGETRQLALASNGDVYVQCLIDVNGTTSTSDDIDAILRIANAPAPIVYCTAGLTSNGCVPAIAASASPSVSAANACNITIASVEGQKSGLVFYSISGAQASPWSATSSSFLCVKVPTQRSGTQNSGGTNGACDGSLALDWNAFQAANPTALGNPWSVGDKAYVQGWFRDPPAPKTTNLSDAVELTYAP